MLEQISVLQPVEDPMLQQMGISLMNCSPWKAHAAAEEKCEEGGSAERNCSPLHPPHHLGQGGREVGIKGVMLGMRKWRGVLMCL